MNGGVASSRRCPAPRHLASVRDKVSGAMRIPDRSVFYMIGLRTGIGVEHACRKVDVLMDVALVWLATYDFNDPAEQNEPIVRILEARSRRKSDRSGTKELHVISEAPHFRPACLVLRSKNIACTARMVEQFVNRDLSSEIMVRVIRPIGRDRSIQREPALLNKLKNCYRSEHFIHGADTELRIGRVRNLL